MHPQVRANSLQELVYKQGQAGVTKATVSIVFNNSDKANGPVEYQHLDQITVTRQVIFIHLVHSLDTASKRIVQLTTRGCMSVANQYVSTFSLETHACASTQLWEPALAYL